MTTGFYDGFDADNSFPYAPPTTVDNTPDYPFPPGQQYIPPDVFDTTPPYTPPAAYSPTDQDAGTAFRLQMQQKRHDPRMTALSPLVKGLQRGFMCQGTDVGGGKGYDGKGLRRFSFLFNPSTLPVSYSATADVAATGSQGDTSGASDTAIGAAGGSSVSISLLLDRTYETWSDRSSRGVLEDVYQLERMTGYSEANPWMQQAAYVHFFMGPFHHYYGIVDNMTVTYTNWTQWMVPNRASVDLQIQVFPWSGASYDPVLLPNAATDGGGAGDSAGASQTLAQQVPKGSTTGLYTPNGYAASKNPNDIQVTARTVPGTTVRLAVAGPVAPLLLWAASQWHTTVEHLIASQCGGYNFRANVNDPNVLSNHSSGTAIDLNSVVHPNAVPATSNLTTGQIAAVHNIIANAQGTLRWGGDYHSTPDPMHIEINASLDQVALLIQHMGLS